MSNLESLDGWAVKKGVLKKIYSFEDFGEAIAFVDDVAEIAEEEHHHPDIRIFSYKNVEISLTTHGENGLTDKDYRLAAKIDILT